MKILGIIFILIAGGVAYHGYTKTGEGSYLEILRSNAVHDIKGQSDVVKLGNYIETVVKLSEAQGNPVNYRQVAETRERNETAKSKLMEYQEALRSTDEQIADLRKWTYGPAGILTVIGLILLVIPSPQRSAGYDLTEALLKKPDA